MFPKKAAQKSLFTLKKLILVAFLEIKIRFIFLFKGSQFLKEEVLKNVACFWTEISNKLAIYGLICPSK
jgi:hypothetical protein